MSRTCRSRASSATSFGLDAARVRTVEEFESAWDELADRGRAVLIEVVTDPDVLAPGLRASDLAPPGAAPGLPA